MHTKPKKNARKMVVVVPELGRRKETPKLAYLSIQHTKGFDAHRAVWPCT